MKHTMKKPSYYLLSQAMDGDEKAIEKILAFYDPYISKCCLRPLYDVVTTCQGRNFPLSCIAFFAAISSPPQQGTSMRTMVTD